MKLLILVPEIILLNVNQVFHFLWCESGRVGIFCLWRFLIWVLMFIVVQARQARQTRSGSTFKAELKLAA